MSKVAIKLKEILKYNKGAVKRPEVILMEDSGGSYEPAYGMFRASRTGY